MNEQDFYQTIFQRKSIRKYDLTPLEDDRLLKIREQIEQLTAMDYDIKVEMKLLNDNEIKNLFPIKAPHYISVFSEVKDGYLTNVGFMLQQMDLYFSANGIGSCWLGMAKPTREMRNSELEFVVMLAFGMPMEPLHRQNISEFKRKSLTEITDIQGEEELLACVRLAPSATNSQPWFFSKVGDTFHAYCVKSNLIKALVYEKMNKINMGIAICHLWTAVSQLNKKAEFKFDESALNNIPKGYYYITSITIK